MKKSVLLAFGVLVGFQLIAAFLTAAFGYQFGTEDAGMFYMFAALLWFCTLPAFFVK